MRMRSSMFCTIFVLVVCCLGCTVLMLHKLRILEKEKGGTHPVERVAYPEPLVFTYEKGDVIGGFAVKIAAALTAQGILTVALGNVQHPDYFWHSAYRPNQWRPTIRRNQSVFYNLENVRVDPKQGETVLQTRYAESDQTGNQHILYVPWAWVAFEERYHIPDPNALLRGRDFDAWTELREKTRFCSFMASYCNYEESYLQIYGPFMAGIKQVRGFIFPSSPCLHLTVRGLGDQERTKFYELLNATYKPVDALGRCHHNTEQPRRPLLPQGQLWSVHDQSIWMMKPYKFAMCMENMATPGYFTEKLFNAYLARAVPVYWGDPLIDKLVNTEAFVWCRPNEPWETCIDQIKALDQDDARYMRMLSQPILKGNVIPPWMNYTVLASRLARLWNLPRR